MSDERHATAGGIILPTERPADVVTMPALGSERTIRQLADDVDSLRRIHLIDQALALSGGGRKESWRAAESGADLDDALCKLIDRLRADGLA